MKKIYLAIMIVAVFVFLVATEIHEPLMQITMKAITGKNTGVTTSVGTIDEISPKVDLDMLLRPSDLSDAYVDNYATAYGMYYSPAVDMEGVGPGYYGITGPGLGIISDMPNSGPVYGSQPPGSTGGVFPGRAPDLLHVADLSSVPSLSGGVSGGAIGVGTNPEENTGGGTSGDGNIGEPNTFPETPPAPVPEPSSILLVATGLVGLLPFTRRHRLSRK